MQTTLIVRVPISKLEGFCQNDAERKIFDAYQRWSKAPRDALRKKASWPFAKGASTHFWFFAEPGVRFVVFVYVHSGFSDRFLQAIRGNHMERGADKMEDAREGVLMSEQVRDFFADK